MSNTTCSAPKQLNLAPLAAEEQVQTPQIEKTGTAMTPVTLSPTTTTTGGDGNQDNNKNGTDNNAMLKPADAATAATALQKRRKSITIKSHSCALLTTTNTTGSAMTDPSDAAATSGDAGDSSDVRATHRSGKKAHEHNQERRSSSLPCTQCGCKGHCNHNSESDTNSSRKVEPFCLKKATTRNYLHGRVAATSLLGPSELDRHIPERKLRVFVGTWNMNGRPPPLDVCSLVLPEELGLLPDVVAVGTQEGQGPSERISWEISLQEALGPAYVLFHSTALGSLHLALFLRRELVWFCSVPEEASMSTRPGAAFKTKGAIALAVVLFGTSFLFVTCHLTAHVDKQKDRCSEITKITSSLDLPRIIPLKHRHKDVTDNYDCVFWFGDLNFRLIQPREEVLLRLAEGRWDKLMEGDQLLALLRDGHALKGFKEASRVHFAPTYKFDVGSCRYDTSTKKRVPSYTDRILIKHRGNANAIKCLHYASGADVIRTSDHRPVWALFETTIRPGKDNIPLSGGLFNREVYLAGLDRRARALEPSASGKNSMVCSLQ